MMLLIRCYEYYGFLCVLYMHIVHNCLTKLNFTYLLSPLSVVSTNVAFKGKWGRISRKQHRRENVLVFIGKKILCKYFANTCYFFRPLHVSRWKKLQCDSGMNLKVIRYWWRRNLRWSWDVWVNSLLSLYSALIITTLILVWHPNSNSNSHPLYFCLCISFFS